MFGKLDDQLDGHRYKTFTLLQVKGSNQELTVVIYLNVRALRTIC